MITPIEAARLVDYPNPGRYKEIHDFVLSASAKELQLFVHLIATDTTDARDWKNRARIALDIKLAEDSERTAQKLVTGTDTLVQLSGTLTHQTETLVKLIEQQTKSAQILEHYTRSLVRLTWTLVWLTVVVLIVTVGLAVFHWSA